MANVFDRVKDFVAPVDTSDEDEVVNDPVYVEPETKPVSSLEPSQGKVNNIPSNAQMVLFEPRSYEEAESIAQHLKARKACVVNLHRLQRDYAQRTIDFLTGVVVALDGTIQKVGHNVILCTPHSVNVGGEISLESDD